MAACGPWLAIGLRAGGTNSNRLPSPCLSSHPENHSTPPDVTGYTTDSIQVERPQGSTTASRATPKYGNAELMETGDGEYTQGLG